MSDILILGYSNIAQKRVMPALEDIKSIKKIEIASLSKKVDIKGKIVKIYNDYTDALKNFNGNLVYISLSNHLHDKYVKKVLSMGLNCIVDKPSILNDSTIDFIKEAVSKNNLIIAESVVFQNHPAWNSSVSALGGSQNISNVQGNFTIPELPSDNFRMNTIYGGGAHTDMSAYALGIGRWLWNSDPLSINISNLVTKNDFIKSFSVLVNYEENKTVSGSFGFGLDYQNTIIMKSKEDYCSYDRVFSPPADLEISLVGIINNNNFTKKIRPADTFKIFLNEVINDSNSHKTNSDSWYIKTKNTFYDFQKLRNEILLERSKND